MTYDAEADIVRMVELILAETPPSDPDERTAYDLLASWDRQTNPENTGATVAILTLAYLLEADDTTCRFPT